MKTKGTALFIERHKAAGLKSLAQHAAAIRHLGQRVTRDLIKIGERLTAAKQICRPGDWAAWLEHEFNWSESTARNFMNVAELAKTQRVAEMDFPLRSLYLLARPSTPEAVREKVLAQAERGEPPSYDDIKETIAEAKPPQPNKRAALPAPAPTRDQLLYEISNLFGRIDKGQRTDCLVQLFRLLGRREQATAFHRLRQFVTGSAGPAT